MIRQIVRARRRQILIDISTQRDFLLADGGACVRNHRRVLANIRRVMAWARHRNIPIISTCEIYPNSNGGSAMQYCIAGTKGQQKLHYTLVNSRIDFAADGDMNFPANLLRKYRQVVLQKRSIDPFEEPRIERLLTEVQARELILIGACAEGAIQAMALGLLQRNKRVRIVADAVGSLDTKAAKLAIRKIKAKGAKLIDTSQLAGRSHLKQVRACSCKICRGAERLISTEVATI